MKIIPDLSEGLRPILEYELARDNKIERVDRPAGSNCPLAVIFLEPLDVKGFLSTQNMPSAVRTWENRDRHYPLEKGFVCERTHHAIAGPLNRNG